MKRNSPLISCLLFAVILLWTVGCAKKPDDAKISGEIQDRFSQDSGLGMKQLSVKAESGVVTLSGTVDTDAQREAAGKQAASVAGVKTVINNLQVRNIDKPSAVAAMTPPPSTSPATSAADNTAPRSATKSSRSLKSSRSGSNSDTVQKSTDDSGASQSMPEASTPPPPGGPTTNA